MALFAHYSSVGKREDDEEDHEWKKSDSSVQWLVTLGKLEKEWDEVDGNEDWARASGRLYE